jgi:uncharacterized protein (TIGR00251 family)
MELYLKKHADGVSFRVRVQPRSKENRIVGIHDDALKMKISAPPVDGAANALCIKFLAKQLKVPKSSLQIESGHTGRIKMIRLTLSKQRDLIDAANRINFLANLVKGKA